MGRNKDNALKAKKQGYIKTKAQLKNWGLKFHKLFNQIKTILRYFYR